MLRVIVLWGVPGAGKSTFARWLRNHFGYEYVDTDAATLRPRAGSRGASWINHPEAFIQAAVRARESIVVEYGFFATNDEVNRLRRLEELGCSPWWFDGDRTAAKDSWRAENARANRPFEDSKWDEVVRVVDENWAALTSYFGSRIIRTVEAGPTHVAPDLSYQAMRDIAVELGDSR